MLRTRLLTALLLTGATVSFTSSALACPPQNYREPSAEEIRASKAQSIFVGRVLEITSVERETHDNKDLELLAITVLTRENLKGDAPLDTLVTVYLVVDAEASPGLAIPSAMRDHILPISANILPEAPRELDHLIFFAREVSGDDTRYALCDNAQFYVAHADPETVDATRRAISLSNTDFPIIY